MSGQQPSQQTNGSQSPKRRTIFPLWARITLFTLALVLLVTAGVFWVARVWGDSTTVFSAIFTVAGVILVLVGLLPVLFSSHDSSSTASAQPLPQSQNSNDHLRQYQLNEALDTSLEQVVNDFVGRRFLFNEVDQWLKNPAQTGYLIIQAEPGFGKTAFVAALVRRSGWIHHYVDLKRGINKPQDFLENVCAQLIIDYKLPTTYIQEINSRPNTILYKLLSEVASNVKNKPIVILVDALDEASDTGLTEGANRLFLPPSLPTGVFIIATTRSEAPSTSFEAKRSVFDVKPPTPLKVLPIEGTDPRNMDDVREYISKFIEERYPFMKERIKEWNMSPPQFVDMLLEKSEGNFLYTTLVLEDIRDNAINRETIDDLDHLPVGLRGYYFSQWQRMKVSSPERFERLYKPVACFLAAAQAPVPVREIAYFTGLTNDEVLQVLQDWRQFFRQSRSKEGELLYRFFHASFRDFLFKEEALGLQYFYEQIKADYYRRLRIKREGGPEQ